MSRKTYHDNVAPLWYMVQEIFDDPLLELLMVDVAMIVVGVEVDFLVL